MEAPRFAAPYWGIRNLRISRSPVNPPDSIRWGFSTPSFPGRDSRSQQRNATHPTGFPIARPRAFYRERGSASTGPQHGYVVRRSRQACTLTRRASSYYALSERSWGYCAPERTNAAFYGLDELPVDELKGELGRENRLRPPRDRIGVRVAAWPESSPADPRRQ